MLSLWVVWSGLFLTFFQVTAHRPLDDASQTSQSSTERTSDWSSLLFHFKLKRSSMNFYGHSTFSVFANPIVSNGETRVMYDLFGTFNDSTRVYNYTLVDGVAYLQSNLLKRKSEPPSLECLDSSSSIFPSINAIVSALNQAVPVSSLSGNLGKTIKCQSGNVYKVSISGFDFALCVSPNSSFTIYGSDLDIEVKYIKERVDIVAPTIADDRGETCKALVSSNIVTEIGKSLLTGEARHLANSRKLEGMASFFFDEETTCSCKSIPRPCIFIHGLGVKNESPHNQDSLPYWGNISNHAPCCSSLQFAHLNTVNNSWMKPAQQQKVCDRALAVSNSSTNFTISDTIILTHSMGTLMLAGAVAHGRCEVDSSSTWVSTAAPLLGSMGSDYIQKACTGKYNALMETLAELRDQCPPSTAMKSLAYANMSYSSPKLNKAYRVVQEVYRTNVSAAMCSESYAGILSPYQATFWVLGLAIPHKSRRNDGVVEYQSCTKGFPDSKFGDSYKDRFYRTRLNHYDMQFRGGDALLDKSKMPVKWFECLL